MFPCPPQLQGQEPGHHGHVPLAPSTRFCIGPARYGTLIPNHSPLQCSIFPMAYTHRLRATKGAAADRASPVPRRPREHSPRALPVLRQRGGRLWLFTAAPLAHSLVRGNDTCTGLTLDHDYTQGISPPAAHSTPNTKSPLGKLDSGYRLGFHRTCRTYRARWSS